MYLISLKFWACHCSGSQRCRARTSISSLSLPLVLAIVPWSFSRPLILRASGQTWIAKSGSLPGKKRTKTMHLWYVFSSLFVQRTLHCSSELKYFCMYAQVLGIRRNSDWIEVGRCIRAFSCHRFKFYLLLKMPRYSFEIPQRARKKQPHAQSEV